MNLIILLQARFQRALETLVDDPSPYVAMIRPAQNPDHGDYQANCAMSLAKVLKQKPRDVAQSIVDKLEISDFVDEPEIAGPGFINLRLKDEWLATQVQQTAADHRLGVSPPETPRTFVVDYSAPNVAKPMHVGHLRSTIIGDALVRLLRFLGHKVIGDNHLGDWGKQFGMILWGWKNHRDEQAYERDPVSELARLYRLAADAIKPFETFGRNVQKIHSLENEGKTKEAEELKKKVLGGRDLADVEVQVKAGRAADRAALAETVKLHEGDTENRKLWQQFIPHCLGALRAVYERLDVHFDEELGESAYDDMLADVVRDLEEKKLAEESDGAIVVFVEGMPVPFIVRKSDGAFNYATTDLATIKYRKDHFKPDVMLYVVDHRQGDHFRSLFNVARRWGYDHVEMEHVAFGTIMGKDKRPYKTREGDVVGLESLLDEAVARARTVVDENSPDLSEVERQQVAEIVGIGAVKYADLSQNRTSDYVFDWDKMMAMDGNTSTYLQYAYARNRSIFRKGDVDVAPYRSDPPPPILETRFERDLALQLLRFPEALGAAAAEHKPNLITSYLWDLAKSYSVFNTNCRVLKPERPELRPSRLLLCDLTARVIRRGLDLLGIRTVERM